VEFSDVVRKRRMVHVFDDRGIDRELVDRLLDIARRGPSAGFSQGTDFLVLDEPSTRRRFWELTEDPRFPPEAGELDAAPPVLIILLADPARYVERYSRPDKIAFGLDHADAWPVKFWDTDTAMAGMLLLLAGVDAGLGAWYFGIPHGEAALRQEFHIPEDRNIIGVIGLGHPGVDERPRGSAYSLARRPLGEMVHRNEW
jgi:nitroreductase